jgi:hypothetical protein
MSEDAGRVAGFFVSKIREDWIPAFAGMTLSGLQFNVRTIKVLTYSNTQSSKT